MKNKLISLLMTITMLMALTACQAKSDPPTTSVPSKDATTPSTSPTTASEAEQGAMASTPKETAPQTKADVPTEAPKVSITKNPTGETVTEGENITVEKAAVEADLSSFEGIIAQYQAAIQGKYDPAQMMELGLNYMIPECLNQDERARVGYSIFDMDGDGQTELVLSANSESEYYTGLIFAVYGMENGTSQLLLESGERNRWYYAGDGKLLNITSGSASESGWYLCTADRDLPYLDAIEYNAGEHPNDPWLKFTGETWEHTTQSEADQKVMDFTNLVSNLEMTVF